MTTYNHEKYIGQAIESALSQKTNFKYKIIIGEDCSTDNTRNIVRDFQSKYPDKIKAVFNEKNLGVVKNGLQIFRACYAKYVATLAGDDYWIDNTKLQKQIDFMENNHQYSFTFTNGIIVNGNNEVVKEERVLAEYGRDLCQRDLLAYCPPADSIIFKNELLKKYLDLVPDSINVDYFLYSLIATEGDAGYLNMKLSAYRIHDNNVWANKDEYYTTINYLKVNRSLEKYILPQNIDLVKKNINGAYQKLSKIIMKEDYTENGHWTPQTAMLRSIRDTVLKIDGAPQNALSIDNNPTIEKMLLCKWPELEITVAKWPEYDAQNLHQFNDETFDIVFSHQVLEHIPKPWIAAKEMNRVLKKGGIGIHSSCAYNPRHGYPAFKDYYRFLPDGLAELFDGVNIWVKEGWGSKEAIIYNLTIDDGHGQLGGRRFVEALGKKNDENYPWHTWVIFQKQ